MNTSSARLQSVDAHYVIHAYQSPLEEAREDLEVNLDHVAHSLEKFESRLSSATHCQQVYLHCVTLKAWIHNKPTISELLHDKVAALEEETLRALDFGHHARAEHLKHMPETLAMLRHLADTFAFETQLLDLMLTH